ncbi:FAD-binding oxidoreductase [Paracoccus sp. Z118]|uniref:NAD(P)/FAD-dependent oxidoreductase n=1 Tax=Paracoccus sp. Z118 TaxID=2851017 RepID=UPI001C2C53B7|nr:FAD-binding oxidoreductase [Paracoccus sp. Z118]MBV0891770.1 FAD-binding oxidoreductase [Paracoccus sp. Z118]
MVDVLIAGGAVMGASVAFWLKRLDPSLDIEVIEQDPSYATSSTALAASGIRMQFSDPVNVAISRFGLDFIRDFARHVGPSGEVADLGFKENGYLFLTTSGTGAATLESLAAMQREMGASTQVLDRAGLAEKFPWMALDDISAGSYGPRGEGFFDNMGLLNGLKNAARAAGVRWVRDRVTTLEREGDRIVAAVLEQGGRKTAQVFVNCAGPRAAILMRTVDLDLPVEPRKRTVFVVDAPLARHPDAPLVIDPLGIWFRPEHGQWLAATVPATDGPCAPDDFEPDLDLFESEIWPALYARAPGFEQAKVLRWWVGHYAFNTLDQNAILGRNPQVPNLYHANGFSGHGLQQAPAVGRGIAEQIVHGDWVSLDLSPLGMQRVLDGRPMTEAAIV